MFDVSLKLRAATRALQVRDTRRHNVAVGAVLALVAVVACVLVALLLWYLKRQSRQERRWANRIDLLDPGSFDNRDVPGPVVVRERDESVLNVEKPLPYIPTSPPITAFAHSDYRRTSSTSSHTSAFKPDVAEIIKRPPPVMPTTSRWSLSTTDPVSASYHTLHFSTRGTSETAMKPATSAFSFLAKLPLSRSGDSDSHGTFPKTKNLTVMNLSDADSVSLGTIPTLETEKDLPPSYTSNRIRGRDQPFPCKQPRKSRPSSILVTSNKQDELNDGNHLSSVLPHQQSFLEVPASPSYAVRIPRAAGTPIRQNSRPPLTITASCPVSSVVVGDVSHIRRADGSKGKGRMVTMSVVLEESGSSDGDADSRHGTLRPISERSESHGVENRLGSIGSTLDQYADLPPYYEGPSQQRSGLASAGSIENSSGDAGDMKN